MFGHLKAEDFTTLIEDAELPPNRRAHLDSCTRCKATFQALHYVEASLTGPDEENIPEPDWTEFRSDLRDAMLSRSVQRDSVVRRWTGFALRPAMAWGLSIVLVVGLSAGIWIWNKPVENVPANVPIEAFAEGPVAESDIASWSQGDVFDQLTQLKDDEVESLRQLLEADHPNVSPTQ